MENEMHMHGCCCGHGCDHHHDKNNEIKAFGAPALSLVMLIAGVLMSYFGFRFFTENAYVTLVWYIFAFIPVGLPVLQESWEGILTKDFFNEFTLMSIACIGAFYIGEYPEAVGVMLFYSIGEALQDRAVDKARRNISDLLDVREIKAHVIDSDGVSSAMDPKTVSIGEIIEVRPGERVPLDGILLSDSGTFDTSALTGESVPRSVENGGEVLAGMISSDTTVRLKVSRHYSDSALSRILELVENAAAKKAKTELFIRKFARVYTPVVIALAVLLVVVPWIISLAAPSFNFVFTEWLSRALVFLVISCPCALVISVPLGYFAGIGAASKAGILFKGGNFLETVRKLTTVAFDKTGTLTTGSFTVEKVVDSTHEASQLADPTYGLEILHYMASAELNSTHPLAKALVDYVRSQRIVTLSTPSLMKEIPGYGVSAQVDGKSVLAGSLKLMRKENISYPQDIKGSDGTIIACAVDGKFLGYVTLADTVKPDAAKAVKDLKTLGVEEVVMLSGDRKEIVSEYAGHLGITEAYGELFPEDKATYVEKVSGVPGKTVAFVGDGMNDAPVLAISDVGIAMGGLGSDAAIESADVVIQTDSPSRVATAVRIGRSTHAIVMENIIGAIGIKVAILVLGAFGIATMWAAVFADVGVALLAVLNSMRIMRMKF